VENLPHPNVYLIFEKGTSVVSGVQTRKFSRVLKGKAQVFGVKFRAGGFQPFFDGAVAKLVNRVVAAQRIWKGCGGAGASRFTCKRSTRDDLRGGAVFSGAGVEGGCHSGAGE
jgi:hypothetical protein